MKISCTAVNSWLGKRMFLVVLSALIIGFIAKVPDGPHIRVLLVVLFAYMTFVTSLGTSMKSFIQVMGRPWIPLWVLLLIHIVTPLTAWFLGDLLYANAPQTQLGLLVGAAIPVGVTSVMWTALNQGNIPISLVAVTLDTMIVPALLPLYYKMIVGQAVAINYTSLVIQLLLMVTIPSIAGMLIHDWTGGKTSGFAKGAGGMTSKLALFVVIFFNGSLVAPAINLSLDIVQMIAVALLMVLSAYALGYVGSLFVPNRTRDVTMAMIYSVGMRNASCGLVIAITYFPPAVAVPIALLMLFQQPTAAVIPTILKYFDEKRIRSQHETTASY
ncbi:bile acid:sodium symporter/arsenical resistance protein acr3 [Lucifera butyrica]|uniref:Bile acid:sodium symporter/arsenical resistance protein acr3 n=1 Tax=Lucifera butyrica TaxID=1351585 RepID=A0A498R4I9_9FIRM|nr:bile acid:sodium symporter family protein [Lucifera butyrica]VBB05093.1 bile acid:sodium symporter/arsenical resistance protein acr3 [Lucifera butyrica]